MGDARPDRSADRFFARSFNLFVSVGEIIWKEANKAASNGKDDCRDNEQIGRPNVSNLTSRDKRPENAPKRSTDGDESKEALALFDREQIGHEGPEDRGVKQIEDADPDIEGTANPDLLFRGSRPHQEEEEDQIENEKAVGERDELSP